jgi:hypothetical protein
VGALEGGARIREEGILQRHPGQRRPVNRIGRPHARRVRILLRVVLRRHLLRRRGRHCSRRVAVCWTRIRNPQLRLIRTLPIPRPLLLNRHRAQKLLPAPNALQTPLNPSTTQSSQTSVARRGKLHFSLPLHQTPAPQPRIRVSSSVCW